MKISNERAIYPPPFVISPNSTCLNIIPFQNSLKQLQKAVKGFLVMSEKLEKIYNSFLLNTVPETWENAAYPSLRPLSSWMKDLTLRVQFIIQWFKHGAPTSYWISGFFFPQGWSLTSIERA